MRIGTSLARLAGWMILASTSASAAVAWSSSAKAAALPDHIPVQIRLDRGNVPVAGSVDLRLGLFAAPEGGTALVSSELPGTEFRDGLATVRIGTGLSSSLDGMWIETEVSEPGAAEFVRLQPRIALGTSPLALVAGGVRPAAIGASSVRINQVQLRVQGCPVGTDRLLQVGSIGNVFCIADRSGVSDLLATDGLLLSASGSQRGFAVDHAVVQRRVASTCAAGSAIAGIGIDGSPLCVPDSHITAAQLQSVTASCVVDATVGVITQCSAAAFCPPAAPLPVSVGFGNNCVGSNVRRLVPTETPEGVGFTTTMFKDENTQCSGLPARHNLYLTCAPVE